MKMNMGRILFDGYPQGLHFLVEMAAFHPYQFGGFGYIAVIFLKFDPEIVLFELTAGLFEGAQMVVSLSGRLDWKRQQGGIAEEKGHIIQFDMVTGTHDDQPLDQIAQLANIARPAMALEQL